MKILTFLLLLICSNPLLAQDEYFSTKEIKDTLNKYDIFKAYGKLQSKNIPYDSIMLDIEIKQSFIKLLNVDEQKEYLIKKEKEKVLKKLSKKDFDSLAFIENYIDYSFFNKRIRDNTKNKIKDSIKIDKNLYIKYLDSAITNKINYEISIIHQKYKYDDENIINFLYKTKWKEVIDYTKNFCHNHDESWNDFCKIRLINMNDTETIKNHERYFLQKLNTGKLEYDDYIFIKRFYYNKSFLLKLYYHIIQSKKEYKIDPFEGYIKPINNFNNIKIYLQTLKGTAFDDSIELLNLDKKQYFKTENTPNYEKLSLFIKNYLPLYSLRCGVSCLYPLKNKKRARGLHQQKTSIKKYIAPPK